MDILAEALSYLDEIPQLRAWPEMQAMARGAMEKNKNIWVLPAVGCEAVGRPREEAIPGVVALGCMQISIILIDDMLDDDPRGEYHRIGVGGAANMASAFQALALLAIEKSEADESSKLLIHRGLNEMMYTTALGQFLDAGNPATEEDYWKVVRTKSCPFYSSGLYVGALLGGASVEVAKQIKQFGNIYGEIIQIHDDLNDTMEKPAGPDWTSGRYPLPILFAHVVEHPERARFAALREEIPDPEALEEAQKILVRCGAVSYCVDQLLRRYRAAKAHLASIPLAEQKGMDLLLEEVIDPVRELMHGLGPSAPDELLARSQGEVD